MKPELTIVVGPLVVAAALWLIQRNGGTWWYYVCAAAGVAMTLEALMKIAKRDNR
jgi:hypothetical protein